MSAEAWRGVAAETKGEQVSSSASGLLRQRSRRLLGEMLRPYRSALVASGVLVVLNTVASLAGPYIVRLGIDQGIEPLIGQPDASRATLVAAVIAFLVVSAASAGLQLAFLRVSGRMGQAVLFDLRMRLFNQFQRLSLSFFERYTSGRMVARLTSDIDSIAELLNTGLVSVVTSILSVVGIGIILVVMDPVLAAVTLLVFPLILLVTRWFRHHSQRAYREGRKWVALVIITFTESLGGIRAVHAFRRERRNQEIFEDVNARYRDANVWSSRLAATYGPGVNVLGRLTTAVVLAFGGFRALDGHITVGTLAAFILYLRQFFEPMHELSQFYNVFQASSAALENISGVLEEEPSVPEPLVPRIPEQARGEVRFENVTFAYRAEQQPILDRLDLMIPAGQTVALVGETGAGKSTIARLMARFYDPVDGRILLDGVDLRDLPSAALRRSVVMVTQEQFLFSGSVADNIAFGRPTASREEIEEAARAIGADEFIRRLPDGFDTDVRTRGLRLSSGQRQLVAFARAFLADPAVLILDEATSSLDLPTERLVQRALRTLLAERTAVIIAHRLSTVEIADRVLVIDGGRIVEDGSPRELVSGEGRYSALHQAWLESLV